MCALQADDDRTFLFGGIGVVVVGFIWRAARPPQLPQHARGDWTACGASTAGLFCAFNILREKLENKSLTVAEEVKGKVLYGRNCVAERNTTSMSVWFKGFIVIFFSQLTNFVCLVVPINQEVTN